MLNIKAGTAGSQTQLYGCQIHCSCDLNGTLFTFDPYGFIFMHFYISE